MTRVDFYVLPEALPRGCEQLACRLTEKAYSLGHQIYIHAHTPDEAQTLDDLLWTFRAGSFLPHALYSDSGQLPHADLPIWIGWHTPPAHSTDILINLAQSVPAFFSRFARVAELVDQEEQRKRIGRERFRYYREQGYTPDTHNLTTAGAHE